MTATIIFGLAPAATGAVAAPTTFACVLAATATATATAAPPDLQETITISFDAAARTAAVTAASGAYAFSKLSVSSVAISGIAKDASFGIDLSTLHLVWQRYDDNKSVIRYGACHKAPPPGAAGQSG
ncbi:MAG: hypothetical protein P4M07_15925 [Xanthobacteraceae bacterium]|nr:hypothetical protein [Xanthobacteraceae bacterium]